MKSYLLNENEVHLEKGTKYFEKISEPLQTLHISGEKTPVGSFTFAEIKKSLEKQNGLIKFTDDSKEIIESTNTIDEKIYSRLEKRIEIDKILPLIEIITLYEFAKVKPEEKNQNGEKLKEYKNVILREFYQELTKIEILDNNNDVDSKTSKIKTFFSNISDFFSSSNIFILFISWLIFFIILFVPISILIINILSFKIDSTILMGLLTAPFIGAITMVATISNKSKK
ncbi:hypothetical protein [Salegentibacter mishustinae]|uniref:hypothetical protein n=1 Tax=Salegentibacter mishustinae TaxID=270918 RepID=UPI00249143B5|nr:hypothetical protein [Salegentibacter mishustinae]